MTNRVLRVVLLFCSLSAASVEAAIPNSVEEDELEFTIAERHNNLGTQHASRGDFRQAAGAFRKAIELDPKMTVAHYNLGLSLSRVANHEDAVFSFQSALRLSPEYFDAWFQLGLAQMGLERYTESIRAFAEGMVLRPGNPTVRFRMGQSHWMLDNWESVISEWEGLLLDAPGHRSVEIVQRELPRAYYNDGLAKQSTGDYPSARRAYQHALSLNANYVSVLNNLAILDQLTGDLDSSADLFERVIELESEHRGARLGLAGIRLGQYRLDEAEILYEVVRSLDPADGQAVRGLAICALKRGERQEALGWADKAGELWSPIDVLMFKAFVLEHNDAGERYGAGFDTEAVIAVYEEAIELDSTRADTYYNLGVIHAKVKRWTDAVAQFDRSLTADSTYSAAKAAIAEVERILESEDTQILKLKRP